LSWEHQRQIEMHFIDEHLCQSSKSQSRAEVWAIPLLLEVKQPFLEISNISLYAQDTTSSLAFTGSTIGENYIMCADGSHS